TKSSYCRRKVSSRLVDVLRRTPGAAQNGLQSGSGGTSESAIRPWRQRPQPGGNDVAQDVINRPPAPAVETPRRGGRRPIRTKRCKSSLSLPRRLWRERWMYALILPGFLYFVVFQYVPLYGNVAAWQDYSPYLGLDKSLWVGWEDFRRIVESSPSRPTGSCG